jgi:hypothetical protein
MIIGLIEAVMGVVNDPQLAFTVDNYLKETTNV